MRATEGLLARSAAQGSAGGGGGQRGQIPHLLRPTPSMMGRGGGEPGFWDIRGGRRSEAAQGQTILRSSRKSQRHHHAQGEVFSQKQVCRGDRLIVILPEGVGLLMPTQLSSNAVGDGGDKLPA